MASTNDQVAAHWQRVCELRDDEQRQDGELVKLCSAAADESAAEQFRLRSDVGEHAAFVGYLVEQLGRADSGAQLSISGCRALLALSFCEENNRYLLAAPGLCAQLERVLAVTFPSEATQKYNPKLDSSALGKIMANPDQGLRDVQTSRDAQLAQLEAQLTPEQRRERDLFAAWQLLRRYAVLLVRNLSKAPPSLTSSSSDSDGHPLLGSDALLQSLLASIGSIYESGEIIYYALQALRFLFEAARRDEPLLRRRAAYLLSLDRATEVLIGTAMTNRVVRKPNGEGLWVHYEACRLLAVVAAALDDEARRLWLAKYACRALSNLVNGSKSPLLHAEGLAALGLLMAATPDAPAVLMRQSSTARHVCMAVLTTLAATLLRYQHDAALALSSQDAELVRTALALLTAFTAHPALPKSEDGTIWAILKHAQADVVLAAFAQRFASFADALAPIVTHTAAAPTH